MKKRKDQIYYINLKQMKNKNKTNVLDGDSNENKNNNNNNLKQMKKNKNKTNYLMEIQMKMRMHRCRNFDERFAILQHCCLQPHTPHDSDREHNDSCAILQNIFVRIAKSARQLALAR